MGGPIYGTHQNSFVCNFFKRRVPRDKGIFREKCVSANFSIVNGYNVVDRTVSRVKDVIGKQPIQSQHLLDHQSEERHRDMEQ